MDKSCKHCGEAIPSERLEVLPDTEYCIKCVDKHGPKVVHDPHELCAKASVSCQNGFAAGD
jgi:hypothetical protein